MERGTAANDDGADGLGPGRERVCTSVFGSLHEAACVSTLMCVAVTVGEESVFPSGLMSPSPVAQFMHCMYPVPTAHSSSLLFSLTSFCHSLFVSLLVALPLSFSFQLAHFHILFPLQHTTLVCRHSNTSLTHSHSLSLHPLPLSTRLPRCSDMLTFSLFCGSSGPLVCLLPWPCPAFAILSWTPAAVLGRSTGPSKPAPHPLGR